MHSLKRGSPLAIRRRFFQANEGFDFGVPARTSMAEGEAYSIATKGYRAKTAGSLSWIAAECTSTGVVNFQRSAMRYDFTLPRKSLQHM